MRTRLAALVVLAASAAGCLGPAIVEAPELVISGAPALGDPAVVALRARSAQCSEVPVDATCSGVLVAPRLVLTAAHCVEGIGARGFVEVSFGPSVQAATTRILAVSSRSHPRYDATTGEYDVGVLLLATDAPVAPMALPTATAMELAPGAALRVVGFGLTMRSAGDSGIKREGIMQLGAVRAASFDAVPGPALSCEGDSGGPVFATVGGSEQLVGITSRGDFACRTQALQVRVDAVLDFVMPEIAAAASAPIGWSAAGTPFADVNTIQCTRDEDCPALALCEAPRCVLPVLGPGSFGASCVTDAECGAGSECARVWPDGADACHCFAASTTPPAMPGHAGCGVAPGRRSGDTWRAGLVVLLLALGRDRARRR